MTYRGRFAPSPSGPLHFGSLIAALASYLQAKKNHGVWLLRIDDIDVQRSQAGAADSILKTLEDFHLYWDESVVFQSERLDRYEDIIRKLQEDQLLYPCSCSRAEIKGHIYPGTCREGVNQINKPTSLRIRVNGSPVTFIDKNYGEISQILEQDVGDFILKRSDQIISYNLAVVVDDFDQQITEIVRGYDLIDTTPRQIFLQQLNHFTTPAYLHFPVATDQAGNKISKQNHAPALDANNCKNLIIDALTFLEQCPPAELYDASIDEILAWSIAHWDINSIPKKSGNVIHQRE